MNCKECTQLIGTYLDGELNAQILSVFEQHLSSCQICRMEVKSFDKCIHMMQAVMKDVAPPDTIRERFFGKTDWRPPDLKT